MKSKLSIIAASLSLFLIIAPHNLAYACYSPCYTPRGYFMYRVCSDSDYLVDSDLEPSVDYNNEGAENCKRWQSITSKNIPIQDIYTVVYKYSCEDIRALQKGSYSADTLLSNNQFAKWIVKNKDTEILNFLQLAKNCEKTRWTQNSPWYYPTKNDGVNVTLQEIARQAKAYKGNRLRDRYALQVIRALFASSRYDECINYWAEIKQSIPDGLMKKMIWPYIAGAYFGIGEKDHAMQIFASLGDVESLRYCSGKQGDKLDDIEILELVYMHCPDSPSFAPMLQKMIRKAEPDGRCWLWAGYTDSPTQLCDMPSPNQYTRLREFALKVARERRVKNVAMWYYTAAFIFDLSENPNEASAVLNLAEQVPGTKLMKESIRVFRIYLDAKLHSYDAKYEHQLFEQLRWLDEKIKNNINQHVKTHTAKWVGGYLRNNYSYYYWNDMMRKILLAEVCPRMVKHGKYTRAIQLANMADNRLLNLVDKIDSNQGMTLLEYRYSNSFNYLDYCNNVFALIDTLGVDKVIAYKNGLDTPDSSLFDKFLNSRGYTNRDYFNDIIGTQCLREMRYKEAEKHLSQVPAAFQYCLNTYRKGCMKTDPFSVAQSAINDESDYKYNFAREMNSLEQTISQTSDPNRKAQLMIRFAIGLRNSFGCSWALTQYYIGSDPRYMSDEKKYWSAVTQKRALKRVKQLYVRAFALFTDKESAAQSHRQLLNYRTVIEKYPDTKAADIIRGTCDNARDYHVLRYDVRKIM